MALTGLCAQSLLDSRPQHDFSAAKWNSSSTPWLLMSSEYGTYTSVEARLWHWLSGKSPWQVLSCSFIARKRQGSGPFGHARLLFSKSHIEKGSNGSKNQPHDAHPVRCRVPVHYEQCSERFRVRQLKKRRQHLKAAGVWWRDRDQTPVWWKKHMANVE